MSGVHLINNTFRLQLKEGFSSIQRKILSPFRLPWLKRATATKNAPILYLPIEIVLQIQSLLPLASQVCLAMSCKAFFNILLSPNELRFPTAIIFKEFITARCELLPLLEDSRWLYCSGCHKLHPIDEFSSLAIRIRPDARYCILSGKYGGIVDLCPCIKLTFRDKLKLVAYLETRTKNNEYSIPRYFYLEAEEIHHRCSMTDQSATVWIHITASLHQSGLLIETQYSIETQYDIETEYPGTLNWIKYNIPLNTCPHRYLIASMLGGNFFQNCVACETSLSSFNLTSTTNGSYYVLKTTRNLGNEKSEAGPVWYKHAANAYSSVSETVNKWRLE